MPSEMYCTDLVMKVRNQEYEIEDDAVLIRIGSWLDSWAHVQIPVGQKLPKFKFVETKRQTRAKKTPYRQ